MVIKMTDTEIFYFEGKRYEGVPNAAYIGYGEFVRESGVDHRIEIRYWIPLPIILEFQKAYKNKVKPEAFENQTVNIKPQDPGETRIIFFNKKQLYVCYIARIQHWPEILGKREKEQLNKKFK